MAVYDEFEHAVAELYSRMGYIVEPNKLIEGRSGAQHQIDVYATERKLLGQKNILVECKYRDNGKSIQKSELANFLLILDDIGVGEGHMVTNNYFAPSTHTLSEQYNIRLIEGEELKRLFRQYNLARYKYIFDSKSSDFSPLTKLVVNFLDDLVFGGVSKKMRFGQKSNGQERYENHNRIGLEERSRDSDEEIDINDFILVENPNIYFDRDIGGLDEVKEKLRLAVIYPNTRRDLYLLYDKTRSNTLLYGPPGCGKNMLAKAVATECNGEFISPLIGDLVRRFPGESERFISALFEYSRTKATNPILFFDELDSVMPRSGPAYVKRIKNEFLEQMDGISSNRGRLSIIGATNRPWLLDVAIRRPGRFDKLVFVPPPDYEAREQILDIYLKKLTLFGMIDDNLEELKEDLASKTEMWSGADLMHLVEDAKEIPLLDAIKNKNRRKLTREDFYQALSKRHPSIKPWFEEAIRSCKRYHEDELLEEIMKYEKNYYPE